MKPRGQVAALDDSIDRVLLVFSRLMPIPVRVVTAKRVPRDEDATVVTRKAVTEFPVLAGVEGLRKNREVAGRERYVGPVPIHCSNVSSIGELVKGQPRTLAHCRCGQHLHRDRLSFRASVRPRSRRRYGHRVAFIPHELPMP